MRTTLTLLLGLLIASAQAQQLKQIWQSPVIDRAEFSASKKYIVLTKNGTGPQVFAAEDSRMLAEWPGIKAALSGDVLLQLRDNQFQGYSTKGKRLGRQWKWPAPEGVTWMTLDGNNLYYTDPSGLHVLDVTTGETTQNRPNHALYPGVVAGDRIYFSNANEVYGLEKNDITRGWRYYCDPHAWSADVAGTYGVSWHYSAFAISPEGKSSWIQKALAPAPFRWHFERETPAAIGDRVFFTAWYAKEDAKAPTQILGKYLVAFDRESATQKWKVSLNASSPVAFRNAVAAIVSTRDGKAHVELRSAINGALITSLPPFVRDENNATKLFSSGGRLFLIRNMSEQKMQITAYQ